MDEEPFYKNLRYTWTFKGLTPTHLIALGMSAMVVLLVLVLANLSTFYAIPVIAAGTVGLFILQWNKPETYVEDLIASALAPSKLISSEEDLTTHQFPVAPEDLFK